MQTYFYNIQSKKSKNERKFDNKWIYVSGYESSNGTFIFSDKNY